MKKTKIFGIGAVALLVMMSTSPIAYSELSENSTDVTNNILSIFNSYRDDLRDIEEYILEYIEEHESYDENFTMPTELQATIDTVLDEISDYVGDAPQSQPELMQEVQELLMAQGPEQQSPPSGGITDIDGPHWFIYWFPGLRIGYYWDVWLSDSACDVLNYANAIAYCIQWFGSVGAIIALVIMACLIAIGNTNQGDGVYFKVVLYIVPVPWLLMLDLAPQ